VSKALALVCVLVAALALFWFTRPRDSQGLPDMASDVAECQSNLRAIYAGLLELAKERGAPPDGSGVAFFGQIVADGVWAGTRAELENLTCPGPGARPRSPDADFHLLGSLTPASSAYAGRDARAHPLATFPSGGPELQALVACDSAENHGGPVNVLFSDGSVRTYEPEPLVRQGRLAAGAPIVVGPDSPLEELRALAPDPPR